MLARIFRPAKTAMQSGRAKTRDWMLEFEAKDALRSDPLMGWTQTGDTASSQVPNVDYVLADEISLPALGGFEPHYSETIYRLPGCFFLTVTEKAAVARDISHCCS